MIYVSKYNYLYSRNVYLFKCMVSTFMIAHGIFDEWYKDRVSSLTNGYLISVTYYIAQFLIGKGTFYAALYSVMKSQT